jgi:hypothetical protein
VHAGAASALLDPVDEAMEAAMSFDPDGADDSDTD